MTDTLMQVLTGCLLGDGSIVKHGRAANARFRFKQSGKFKHYAEHIMGCFSDYVDTYLHEETSRKPSRVDGKISHALEHWKGGYCNNWYFWTRASEEFTQLHSQWYDAGEKVIPKDIDLSPLTIAHWYAQDGSNNVTASSKAAVLATNCFTDAEVDLLRDQLKAKYGFSSGRYQGPTLRIAAASYFDFIDMVKPHLQQFNCMAYKIDASKAPANRKGEQWTKAKLTMKDAKAIRELRIKKGMTLKEIAAQFGVTIGTVGKIVNNQLYKVHTLSIGGSATTTSAARYYGNHR